MEDNELKKKCSDIYNKHQKALDLIYKYSDLGMSPMVRIVREALSELAAEDLVKFEEKDRVVFHTKKMDDFIGILDEPESSWKTKNVYNYWFKINDSDEKVALVFEIGWKGIDSNKDIEDKLETLKEILKPRSTKNNKYQRLKTEKWIELGAKDFEAAVGAVKKNVEKFLKLEDEWISECKEAMNANED